jgi:molybdopterin-guanine dinucleotide biosynthesis protein A
MFKNAAILAGGESSRMGYDKQLIKINDVFLIDIIYYNLSKIFENVVIVTNKPYLYKNRDYKVTTDVLQTKGPLNGIYSALKYYKNDYVYITACDMPFINFNYVKYISQILLNSNYDGIVTKQGEFLEPMNGFYSTSIIENIEKTQGMGSITKMIYSNNFYFLSENNARYFTKDWKLFMNINNLEELNTVSKWLNKT